MTLTDNEIVQRVLQGETALFELILRRYNQRIFRVVRGIVRNDDEAEDVMQQAYVNAYEHLHQFAERAKFSTWLTRIAINEALARMRRREMKVAGGTAVSIDDETVVHQLESPLPDPETQAAASQIRSAVEAEIDQLPDSFRTVLVMREVEGLSTAETAEMLDINEDLVKQRLHRARTMLKENLYKRAGVTMGHLFPFGNWRCDRLVAKVLDRLNLG